MDPTVAMESASGARQALSLSNTGASSCCFHLYASKKLLLKKTKRSTDHDGFDTAIVICAHV